MAERNKHGDEEPVRAMSASWDWFYDDPVARNLRWELEALGEDLDSDDPTVSKKARTEAALIWDWLEGTGAPPDAAEKIRRVREILQLQEDPDIQVAAITRVVLSTGRPRGRPATVRQQAIEALGLHLAEPLSWKQIAFRVRGCKHRGQRADRSCDACADAIRKAVRELEKFLREKGLHPDLPRRYEMKGGSPKRRK